MYSGIIGHAGTGTVDYSKINGCKAKTHKLRQGFIFDFIPTDCVKFGKRLQNCQTKQHMNNYNR